MKSEQLTIEVTDFISADEVHLVFQDRGIYAEIASLCEIGGIDFNSALHAIAELVATFDGDNSKALKFIHILLLLSLNITSTTVVRSDNLE